VYLLPDLLRHNAWANRKVFESFTAAPHVLDVVCYDGKPLLTRLQHQVATERAFLDILRNEAKRPAPPVALDDLLAYDAENAAALESIVKREGEAGQERPYFVPWWKLELPLHVLVSQVVSHSAQHRSELAWELARASVSTGELDFIVWVAGGRPHPGEMSNLPAD
jgi:uncharacterized damage-inducible protein DinB